MQHSSSAAAAAKQLQREDIAANINGLCLVHHLQNRMKYQEVNAWGNRGNSATTFRSKLEVTTQENRQSSILSTLFTRQEALSEPSHRASKFLVVGIALEPQLLQNYSAKLDAATKRYAAQSVGLVRPTDEEIIDLNTVSRSYLVVTPIEYRKSIKFGVLLCPEGGLRTPYIIPHTDIFFFAEFRDESKTLHKRMMGWKLLVRTVVDQKSGGEEEARPLKRARMQSHQNIPVIDLTQSDANDSYPAAGPQSSVDKSSEEKSSMEQSSMENVERLTEPARPIASSSTTTTASTRLSKDEYLLCEMERMSKLILPSAGHNSMSTPSISPNQHHSVLKALAVRITEMNRASEHFDARLVAAIADNGTADFSCPLR